MGMEKFASGAGKWAWGHLEKGFFQFLQRKAKEGTEQFPVLSELYKRWMEVNWGYAAQQYLNYVREFHGQFQVFGVQGEVLLSELSTDVFLYDKPEFSRFEREKPKRISGLRMVFNDERGKKLFIWGEPGAGKTTFLKQVAQTTLQNKPKTIPIFVNIAEWANTSSLNYEGLLNYIALQFKQCGFVDATLFVDYIIYEGIAILLFDGLDEIKSEGQGKVISLFNSFFRISKGQVLITCRVDAIRSRFPSFWEVQIARWNKQRIINFVSKRIPNPEWQGKFFEDLENPERRSLKDFKSNPLLLSLLCWAFDPQKGFPENRAKLYSEATRHLLFERDQEKKEKIGRENIYTNLTLAQKEMLYAHIAYNTFEPGNLFFEQDELEKLIEKALKSNLSKNTTHTIDGSMILPKLVSQHGILSRRGHRTYAFSHLTFQEYYTAKYITENNNASMLEHLADHIEDSRWREVFLLTASLLPEASPLFENMQAAAQRLLQGYPELLTTQAWSFRQATHLSAFKHHTQRAFYWFIALNLAISRELAQMVDSARDFARGITQNPHRSRDLDFVRVRDRAHALSIASILTDDHDLNRDLALELDLALDLAHDLARIPNSSTPYSNLSSPRATSRALLLDLVQNLPAQDRKSHEILCFDLHTTYLLILSNIFVLLSQEDRTKTRLERYQTYLNAWRVMPANPLGEERKIAFPSPPSSYYELEIFNKVFYEAVEKLLELHHSRLWESALVATAKDYLLANQLFWDCLQVAKLSNPEAIEDMILKPLKDNT